MARLKGPRSELASYEAALRGSNAFQANFRAINSQNAKNAPRYREPVETSSHPRSDGVGVGPVRAFAGVGRARWLTV